LKKPRRRLWQAQLIEDLGEVATAERDGRGRLKREIVVGKGNLAFCCLSIYRTGVPGVFVRQTFMHKSADGPEHTSSLGAQYIRVNLGWLPHWVELFENVVMRDASSDWIHLRT
jgi:hypothetical protein